MITHVENAYKRALAYIITRSDKEISAWIDALSCWEEYEGADHDLIEILAGNEVPKARVLAIAFIMKDGCS